MLEELIKIECLKSIEEAFVGLLEFLQLENLNLLFGHNIKYVSLLPGTHILLLASFIILILYKVRVHSLK